MFKIWWSIAIFSSDFNTMYIGRFFSGLGIGGSYTLVPIYITEISEDKIRGSLNAIYVFSMNLGMLLIYISGEFLDYKNAQIMFFSIPIAFILLFSMFPETPIYLIRNGKSVKAEKSLKFLRGMSKNQEFNLETKMEMEKLNKKVEEGLMVRSVWKEATSPVSLKALFYGIMLITLHQFSGLMAFIGYTSDIFRASGSSLTPNMSAIIVGILLIVGSIFSIFVMDKFTRKSLFTITSFGNIIGLIVIGLYGFLEQEIDLSDLKFIPIISLSLVILSNTAGRFPLSYLIVAEIQPQNNRSFGISICSMVNWFVAFIVMRYFSTAIELFQFHNCMFLFCLSLIFNVFFIIAFVPETKGKSYEEIENALSGKLSKENYKEIPLNKV